MDRATLREINHVRAVRGLHRVTFHEGLAGTAFTQSAWMAKSNLLQHPSNLLSRLRGAAPAEKVWGEVLAWMPGSRSTIARRTVNAWMHSPPHRHILLLRPLRVVGIASVTAPNGVFITADFGG